ncbi:hypothetical protein OTU49_013846, partial [Cherax quadricarinatus]
TDLSVCYINDNYTVQVEHYLLHDAAANPQLQHQVLELESWDLDGDYLWCTFSRTLAPGPNSTLNLLEPHFYLYFWGTRNGSTILMPPAGRMLRSPKMISASDKPFNQLVYSGAVSDMPPLFSVAVVLSVMLC